MILNIVNSAAINIHVQVSLLYIYLDFFRYLPKNGIVGSHCSSIFNSVFHLNSWCWLLFWLTCFLKYLILLLNESNFMFLNFIYFDYHIFIVLGYIMKFAKVSTRYNSWIHLPIILLYPLTLILRMFFNFRIDISWNPMPIIHTHTHPHTPTHTHPSLHVNYPLYYFSYV
jgi:hypothetical protein